METPLRRVISCPLLKLGKLSFGPPLDFFATLSFGGCEIVAGYEMGTGAIRVPREGQSMKGEPVPPRTRLDTSQWRGGHGVKLVREPSDLRTREGEDLMS